MLLRTEDLFPITRPVSPHRLIGRRRSLSELTSHVQNGTSTAVIGPRKDGKTSTCEAVVHVLQQTGFVVAVCDLYGIKDADEFAENLLEAVVTETTSFKERISAGVAWGRHARWSPARVIRALSKLEARMDEITAMISVNQVEPAIRALEELARLRSTHAVLFVDEFQRLPLFGEETRTALVRGLRASRRVVLLATGSSRRLARDVFGDPYDPLCTLIGHRAHLDPVTDREWRAGLRDLFKLDGCVIDEDALTLMIEEGHRIGATPVHSIMGIAHYTHAEAKREGARRITTALAMQGFVVAEGNLARLKPTGGDF